MNDLTSLATTLKTITDKNEKNQSEYRISLLRDTLKHMNYWLEQKVRDYGAQIHTASKCLYHAGLVMPICGQRDEARVIVGVVPEMSRVFSTKTRAPYMVPLETVKLSEVQQILNENFKWNYFTKHEIPTDISANQRECLEEEFKISLFKHFNPDDLTESTY